MSVLPEFDSDEVPEIDRSRDQILILSVISQAVQDAVSFRRQFPKAQSIIKSEARRWIASREMHAFSFEWCCLMVDWDPNAIRNALREDPLKVWRGMHPGARKLPEELVAA